MPLYTRRGDGGKTDLHSGERVHKDDVRTEAYGTIDELNALIGKAIAFLEEGEVTEQLQEVQNHLHICQTDLSDTKMDADHPRIGQDATDWLEGRIDEHEEVLPDLDSFLLQGGSRPGSQLFHARAVCRRAERRIVKLGRGDDINEDLVQYINRLSDFLFVTARRVNHDNGIDERHPTY